MLDRDQVAAALSPYEIGEELGRGATGIVLAARHRQLGRDVAVKALPPHLADSPDVRRRFADEAKLLASFSHVHIVPIYDFVERDGLCLLIMERLTGGTLASHARAGLDAPAACAAVLAICSALDYAHGHGVLHRDVKPDNALLTGDGVLKVTDFGIAKVLGGSETQLTRTGFVLGTPSYMAPEQAEGGDPGPETDVYAVATILYELLARRLPFEDGGNLVQALYQRVNTDPKPLLEVAPGVPPELASAVMRSLARDPAERHPSAAALGVAVARAAVDAWGPGWLERTPFTVTARAILSAAHGEREPQGDMTVASPPAAPLEAGPLAGARGGEKARAETESAPADPPPARRRGRRLGLALGGLLALAAAGAGAAVLATDEDRDPPNRPAADRGDRPADTAVPAARGSAWRALRSAPTARQQAPGTARDGTVWVIGGLHDGPSGTPRATRRVEGYDPVINAWQVGPQLPIALHHQQAVTYRGEIVVIGGWSPKGSDLSATESRRVLALRRGRWVDLPRLNGPRIAGAAAVVGDRIVVVGGQAGGRLVETTEVFDGKRWRVAASIPTPREHLAAASDGRYLYAVGGRNLSSDKNSAALERYDPGEDSWERLPDMPTARGGLAAAIARGRLLAVGGETPTEVLDAVESYDIAAGRWSRARPMLTPRHGLAVVALGSSVYALAGARRPGHANSSPVAELTEIARAAR